MNIVNEPFEVVLGLKLSGSAVTGLTTASFSTGDVLLRHVDPTGTSPPTVSPIPVQQFEVEELFSGTGTYAFKFGSGILTAVGDWALRISNTGVIDDALGVIEVGASNPQKLQGWASGVNTVDVVTAYDSNNNPTQVVRYGFDSAADAVAFQNNPSGNGSLVKWTRFSDYAFEISTGRLLRYIQRVP